MEFPFNVNRLFKKKITKVHNDLIPEGVQDIGVVGKPHAEQVAKVVDSMGIASAESQNLFRPVTSADKLKKSDHLLYVMTDPDANNKNGSVIGFLKTGYKNLYLFDKNSRNHETKPLCVLDFYIHESMQRKGLGKQLFDHMLQDVDIAPKYLAMDKPSDSFMRFIKKHYGLFKTIPQAINYVIYDDFFNKRPDGKLQYASRVHGRVPLSDVRGPKKRSSGPAVATPPPPPPPPTTNDNHGRFAAFKPPTTVGECFSYAHVDPGLAAAEAARFNAAAAAAGAAAGAALGTALGTGPDASDAQEMYVPGTPDPQTPGSPNGQMMMTMPGGGMMPMGVQMMPNGQMVQMMPGTPSTPGGQMMVGTPVTPPHGCTPGMEGIQMQSMQGMSPPMPGNAIIMHGVPMQGGQLQGMPSHGGQMQGLQMQEVMMQGAQMHSHPMVSPLVAAGDGIGQGPAAAPTPAVVEAAGMPVSKGGPRTYENMRRTHYTHTPLW